MYSTVRPDWASPYKASFRDYHIIRVDNTVILPESNQDSAILLDLFAIYSKDTQALVGHMAAKCQRSGMIRTWEGILGHKDLSKGQTLGIVQFNDIDEVLLNIEDWLRCGVEISATVFGRDFGNGRRIRSKHFHGLTGVITGVVHPTESSETPRLIMKFELPDTEQGVNISVVNDSLTVYDVKLNSDELTAQIGRFSFATTDLSPV